MASSMKNALTLSLVLVLLNASPAGAMRTGVRASPIRRVLTMLTMMDKKVKEEGKAEEAIFDKYMCYCSESQGTLHHEIAEAEQKIPELNNQIKEATSLVAQLQEELTKHQQERAEAKKTLQEATEIRNKESADFVANKDESQSNIAGLTAAIAALEKGVTQPTDSGSFLQKDEATALRRSLGAPEISADDREAVESFLDDGASRYNPQSTQILGMLKQMADNMNQELGAAIQAESRAEQEFHVMKSDKTSLIASSTEAIRQKKARVSQTNIDIANNQEDLDETSASLGSNKVFLATVEKDCHAKQAEFVTHKRTRVDELRAIEETTNILNGGDTLNLFKDSFPTPDSFLQMHATSQEKRSRREEALRILKAARSGAGTMPLKLNLIALALAGRKVGFDQIVKLIDDRVGLKAEEQQNDDDKRKHCQAELDKSNIKMTGLVQTIADAGTMIDEKVATAKGFKEEIASLVQGIQELDKLVAEATRDRKAEHDEFVETLASNHAAIQLLQLAGARLAEFYGQKNDEEVSSDASPAAGSATAAGTASAAPDAPKYRKSDDGKAVQALIATLEGDLQSEMGSVQASEREAQLNYEDLLSMSKDKRADDAKAIEEKESAVAGLEAGLHKLRGERKRRSDEKASLTTYTEAIHTDCDELLKSFDSWKQTRSQEVEALKRAKLILSGAD